MARATSLVAIVASATGFSLAPWSVPAPRRARALAATHIVDFDCLADTMNLELSVNLEVLQTVRPDPGHPWNAVSEVPTHAFRTFDMARKYTRLLSEMRRAARPADAVMLLRLVFEEDAVGQRALAAREDPSCAKWPGGADECCARNIHRSGRVCSAADDGARGCVVPRG